MHRHASHLAGFSDHGGDVNFIVVIVTVLSLRRPSSGAAARLSSGGRRCGGGLVQASRGSVQLALQLQQLALVAAAQALQLTLRVTDT